MKNIISTMNAMNAEFPVIVNSSNHALSNWIFTDSFFKKERNAGRAFLSRTKEDTHMKDIFVMMIQLLQFIAAERCKFDAETNYEKTLRHYDHRDAHGINALRHLYDWHLWNWLYDQYKPVRVVVVCCATVGSIALACGILLAIVFPYGW